MSNNNNNNNIEETERLLHPETRALLSSINDNAPLYQKYPRERTTTTSKTTKSSNVRTFLTTRNVLGGIGVATVALGSYVSGYRSSIMLGNTTTTTMRLGNEQQQSKKVVLHTGCSPVAQVCETTRDGFFFVSHLSPIPRPLSRLDDDDDDDDYLCFVQTTRSSFRKRWKKNNCTLLLLLLLLLLLDVTTNN